MQQEYNNNQEVDDANHQVNTMHKQVDDANHQVLEKDEEVIEANTQRDQAYALANQRLNQLDDAQAIIQELMQQQAQQPPPQGVEVMFDEDKEEPEEDLEEEPKEEAHEVVDEEVEEDPEEIEGISELDYVEIADPRADDVRSDVESAVNPPPPSAQNLLASTMDMGQLEDAIWEAIQQQVNLFGGNHPPPNFWIAADVSHNSIIFVMKECGSVV